MKLYELEGMLQEKKDSAPLWEPLTLKELFEYGYNNVYVYDEEEGRISLGWDVEDFEPQTIGGITFTLDTMVEVEDEDEDEDGFTIALIKAVEE